MGYSPNTRDNDVAVTRHTTMVNGSNLEAGDVKVEQSFTFLGDPTDRMVGQSPAIMDLRTQIHHLAAFDAVGNLYVPTLLLQGETGTGKGLVARIVHDSGPRAYNPFIEVNCAAIPEMLLEAELFGFEAGAFTDAKRAKPGLFEAASGGTLFLDEIDALPLALQGKLLNAIEAKRIRRLGAVVERPVDIKLIAATPLDLGRCVHDGRFRADLYHRLTVVLLQLPPLRQRGEDCLVLAQHFLRRYAEAHGLPHKRLSRAAEAWILGYDWPGNVRELDHLMERLTLLSQETILDPQTLERLCLPRFESSPPPLESRASDDEPALVDDRTRIRHALIQAEGNVLRAARLLGMSRGALRYRMRRYSIERPSRQDLAQLCSSPPQKPTSPQAPRLPSQAPVALEPCWEQRPVVVLAISLSFSEAAGAEALRDDPWTVSTRWEQRLVEQLTEFDGVILQRSPSLLTAVFGAPRTPEQLPQRAVQAALAIQRLVSDWTVTGEKGAGMEVRMAADRGMALVDVQTRNTTVYVLPMADALTAPVRLLEATAPGEILLSFQLGRLVEGWYTLEERQLGLEDRSSCRSVGYALVGPRLQHAPAEPQGGNP